MNALDPAFEPAPAPRHRAPEEPVYCQCEIDGATRQVVVDIEDGRINSITCATCQRSVNFPDGLEGVYANDVPMTMTTTVEKAQADSWSGFEISGIYHELTVAAE